VRIYILKANAHALAWVRVEHAALGLKKSALLVDLEDNLGSSWPRIGHFHVASVKAQFSHTGGDAGLRPFFKDLDRRDERIPGSSAPLVFHEFTPDGSCGILSLVGQVRGQNKGQNGAKVGEKVMRGVGRGWRLRNFYTNKRTYVLLEFPAFLPMIREYAQPLLLPAPREESGDAASSAFHE
jgi:hypothetical protein